MACPRLFLTAGILFFCKEVMLGGLAWHTQVDVMDLFDPS